MRLTQIRDFLAVVDAGSIRAAARSLGLTQPALTKSLRKLEQELGASLVTRSVRGVAATANGRAFLARARAVSSGLRLAREEIAQLNGAREGSLAIGSAPGPGLGLLPEALVRFRERWPQVAVRLVDVSPAEVLPALREGALDLALSVRMGPLADLPGDCRAVALYPNAAAIIARRGHALAGARRLAALVGAEWIRTAAPHNTSALPDMFRAAGLPEPRYRVDCGSFLLVPALVARSDLLAVVPWQIAERESRADPIVALRMREAIPERQISLFRRVDVPPTPAAGEFAQILQECARRLR
ncbi:MAG: LysR family transcriptional regulator [Burkholderiales bacterium]